jgi:carboxylate-amine ligase
MIDFGKQKEVPTRDLIHELLEFVDDVVDPLGSRKEIEHIHTILQRGTSADEQLEVYHNNNNDLTLVVDRLIERTMENVPVIDNVELTGLKTSSPSTISK